MGFFLSQKELKHRVGQDQPQALDPHSCTLTKAPMSLGDNAVQEAIENSWISVG